ncbi:MAG: hypothetical protein ACYS0I_09835, partial [Planctomycetota bacterium]
MSFYLKILAWCTIFVTAAALTAWADTNEATAEPSAAAGNVAVTVNGVDITESQVEEQIKPQLDRLAARSQKLPPQF